MPSNPNWVYWDSCVFLSIFNNDSDRHPILRTILTEVRISRGLQRICTSTFTVAEVAFIAQEKDQKRLDPSTISIMDGLLGDITIVEQVEASSFIIVKAREYVREAMVRQIRLKPADAVHLATALFVGTAKFHTYNIKDFAPIVDALSLDIEVSEPASISKGPLL